MLSDGPIQGCVPVEPRQIIIVTQLSCVDFTELCPAAISDFAIWRISPSQVDLPAVVGHRSHQIGVNVGQFGQIIEKKY